MVDVEELRSAITIATADVVRGQLDAGIDIGNDGEQAVRAFSRTSSTE